MFVEKMKQMRKKKKEAEAVLLTFFYDQLASCSLADRVVSSPQYDVIISPAPPRSPQTLHLFTQPGGCGQLLNHVSERTARRAREGRDADPDVRRNHGGDSVQMDELHDR